MALLFTFAVIFVTGIVVDVLISLEVEKHFLPAGLPTFFVLLVGVIVGGWYSAVRLTAPRADTAGKV
jgi:biotin transporter BioY